MTGESFDVSHVRGGSYSHFTLHVLMPPRGPIGLKTVMLGPIMNSA